MADDAFPVQWTGQQAVVTLPEHIDDFSSDHVLDQLLQIINHGAAVLIADLSRTVYCDYSGAYALARAQQRAIAVGTEVRLVATRDVARRVFTFTGLGRPVAVYPDLHGAIAAEAESRKPHGEEETQVVGRTAAAEEMVPALRPAPSPASPLARIPVRASSYRSPSSSPSPPTSCSHRPRGSPVVA